jgi:hypothetical protein
LVRNHGVYAGPRVAPESERRSDDQLEEAYEKLMTGFANELGVHTTD